MRLYVAGLVAVLAILITSCASVTVAKLPEGNVKRLIERSDANAARQAAPGFTQDALLTINDLEWQLAKEKEKKK